MHANFTKEKPFPEFNRLQRLASSDDKILVITGEDTRALVEWDLYVSTRLYKHDLLIIRPIRPEMTSEALSGHFSGNPLPPGSLIPPRLIHLELARLKQQIYCYCAKKISIDLPLDGATAQIRLTKGDRKRWTITCHLWHSEIERGLCGYFGKLVDIYFRQIIHSNLSFSAVELEMIWKNLGGTDPLDPRLAISFSLPRAISSSAAVSRVSSTASSSLVKKTRKPHPKTAISASNSDSSSGEVIPPTSPYTPSPSVSKASQPFNGFRGNPPSSASSEGSIVPSSVKSEHSSPIAYQQMQKPRSQRTFIISDDDEDFTIIESNITACPTIGSSTQQAAADGDEMATPKAVKKSKGKRKEAAAHTRDGSDSNPGKFIVMEFLPTMQPNTATTPDLISALATYLMTATRHDSDSDLEGMPVYDKDGKCHWPGRDATGPAPSYASSTPGPQDSSNPFYNAGSYHSVDTYTDRAGAIHYLPTPSNTSPGKKRTHAGSVSSAALGHVENRARLGSFSSGPSSHWQGPGAIAAAPPPPPPLAPNQPAWSPASYWVGPATHSASNFPNGLQFQSPSPYDPFGTPNRPPFLTQPFTQPSPASGFQGSISTPGSTMVAAESTMQASSTVPTPAAAPLPPMIFDGEDATPLVAHIKKRAKIIVPVWGQVDTLQGVHITIFLHAWGLRQCPDCDAIMPAGKVGKHCGGPICPKTNIPPEIEVDQDLE